MPKPSILDRLLGRKAANLSTPTWRKPKFDDTYPEHIENWASKLKGQVEGLRDDSQDLQKKYENAPLRRRSPKKKSPKKK
ncbi:MAG: hypothetical protein RL537_257 [Actinomycetota bacterium]|jgi:hypothetical protein